MKQNDKNLVPATGDFCLWGLDASILRTQRGASPLSPLPRERRAWQGGSAKRPGKSENIASGRIKPGEKEAEMLAETRYRYSSRLAGRKF